MLNYAQLRNFTGLSNMVAEVLGAVSPGDGGQGKYYDSAASTAADNNSTVIVPNGAIQGAWLALSTSLPGTSFIPSYCTASFASNLYSLTPTVSALTPAAYADGQQFLFKAPATSTGSVTANIAALPAYPVFNSTASQAASGDIALGWTYSIEYNSTINSGSPGFELLDRPITSTIYYNVVSFGATGNGATDDTTAIQAAFNAAAAVGGVVFFPAGSYKITTTLTVTSRISILGVGYQSDAGNLYNNQLFTQSTGFVCSAIIPNGSFNAINLAANSAFMVEKIQITYPSQPTSGDDRHCDGFGRRVVLQYGQRDPRRLRHRRGHRDQPDRLLRLCRGQRDHPGFMDDVDLHQSDQDIRLTERPVVGRRDDHPLHLLVGRCQQPHHHSCGRRPAHRQQQAELRQSVRQQRRRAD